MLQAICITLLAGITFGLSLFLTQKVHFISSNPILIGVSSIVRLLLLGRFFYIMLKSAQIHPIILVVSFLIAYWLTILKFKEFMHARS